MKIDKNLYVIILLYYYYYYIVIILLRKMLFILCFCSFFIESYTNGKSNDSIRRNSQETRKLFGHP